VFRFLYLTVLGVAGGFSLVMARDQICRGSRSKGNDAKSYENADCRFYRDICPRIVDGTGIVLLSRNEQWARPDVLGLEDNCDYDEENGHSNENQ